MANPLSASQYWHEVEAAQQALAAAPAGRKERPRQALTAAFLKCANDLDMLPRELARFAG